MYADESFVLIIPIKRQTGMYKCTGTRNIVHAQETEERRHRQVKSAFRKWRWSASASGKGGGIRTHWLQCVLHILANVWGTLQQRTREAVRLAHPGMSCSPFSLVMPGECPGRVWPWLGNDGRSHKYSCLQHPDDLSMSFRVYCSIVPKIAFRLFKRKKKTS